MYVTEDESIERIFSIKLFYLHTPFKLNIIHLRETAKKYCFCDADTDFMAVL